MIVLSMKRKQFYALITVQLLHSRSAPLFSSMRFIRFLMRRRIVIFFSKNRFCSGMYFQNKKCVTLIPLSRKRNGHLIPLCRKIVTMIYTCG